MASGRQSASRPLLTALVLFLSAPVTLWSHEPLEKPKPAQRREVHLPVQDFSLTDQNGRPFHFSKLKGKTVVVNFMYTSCPDVCPLMTADLKQVQDRLHKKEQDRVYFLSLSTDPEIDTPEILKAYGRRYGLDFANWSFLTGERKALARVWRHFGVAVRERARGLVNHTTLTGLIDGRGVMRFAYFGASPNPDVILQDLRELMGSQS